MPKWIDNMPKVNVDVYIWNELRSNDQFGFNLLALLLIAPRGWSTRAIAQRA